jgi:FdhD protein
MPPLPRLTAARVPLTREVEVVDAQGGRRVLRIPDERALALFVDRRELVTLMTLGQAPELLALGYLLNQGLIADVREVESVTVDWDAGAAAVRTRGGIARLDERTARRTVTTGCGQGTVFGELLAGVQALALPDAARAFVRQAELLAVLEAMRLHPGVYREAGSVHGSALWRAGDLLFFVEDVGRHNAVDTIAGWMAMNDVAGADTLLFTTGRLTSEMVLKAARLGVPIVVSRNGVTAMGQQLAARLGLTLIGRASGRRFVCYSAPERIRFDADAESGSGAQFDAKQ